MLLNFRVSVLLSGLHEYLSICVPPVRLSPMICVMDPAGLVCRLIALDKNPGVIPTSIGGIQSLSDC